MSVSSQEIADLKDSVRDLEKWANVLTSQLEATNIALNLLARRLATIEPASAGMR